MVRSASLYVHATGSNGSILARNNSMPARPYMARLSVFKRLICPSAWPLLDGSAMAFLTVSMSRIRVRANCCIERPWNALGHQANDGFAGLVAEQKATKVGRSADARSHAITNAIHVDRTQTDEPGC
jgi:hypothetical protein